MIVSLWDCEAEEGRRWRYRIGLGEVHQLETDGGLFVAMDMLAAIVAGRAELRESDLTWQRVPNCTYVSDTKE